MHILSEYGYYIIFSIHCTWFTHRVKISLFLSLHRSLLSIPLCKDATAGRVHQFGSLLTFRATYHPLINSPNISSSPSFTISACIPSLRGTFLSVRFFVFLFASLSQIYILLFLCPFFLFYIDSPA